MSIGLDQLDPNVLLLIAPLVLLELGLLIAAIADLLRDDRAVRGNNKGLWAVVIVFVNLAGPILYFLVGRVDGPPPSMSPAPDAVPGWGSPHDPPVASAPPTLTATPAVRQVRPASWLPRRRRRPPRTRRPRLRRAPRTRSRSAALPATTRAASSRSTG